MNPTEEESDIRRRVAASHHPHFTVHNLIIGPRTVTGVYATYDVEYWCHPTAAGLIGGSNRRTFTFDNDVEDAALRSASL